MNRTGVYSGLALGVWLAFAAGSGCAGDDAKIAVMDGGASGEGGDSSASGAAALGGSAGGTADAGSGTGGSSDGGMSGEGGSAVGGSDTSSRAGDTSTGVGGGGAGAGAGGGDGGTSEAGAGSTDEGTPVPSACTSCGSDFCVAARVACQSDPACVDCRDENYQTLACAQNSNFMTWINCVCAAGCTAPCSVFCTG